MNPESTSLYQAFGWVGTLVGGIVNIAITAIVSHLVVKLLHRTLYVASEGRIGGSIFTNVARVVIWACGIGAALYFCFNFNVAVIWGALGIGGIALSLGAQSTISNLLGGFQVSLSRDTAVGDWIRIGTTVGEVKDISWRKMIVEDTSGNFYNIPNSILTTSVVESISPYQIVKIPLVLDSQCDLERVKGELPRIVKDALRDADMLYEEKDVAFSVTGTEMTGISAVVKCFVPRSCVAETVSDVAMEAALSCLRSCNALPRGVKDQQSA